MKILVSNRAVKQLIIELYGDAVCFTYPSSKRISQMVLPTKSSPEALVESLRVSTVQQVATELLHKIKEYSFGLQRSFYEPQDLQLSMDRFTENLPPFTRLNCMHEEADDRMMFHVQDILSHRSGPTSLTLSPGDRMSLFACCTTSLPTGEILASKSCGSFATQG